MSKKYFGEEARDFVRYCRDQGIARDRISTALVQLGFEARAVSSALEAELPAPAEGQDDMQALASFTMTMHKPTWRLLRDRVPSGTLAYVTSALAVSITVLFLGWTTATWVMQAPSGKPRYASRVKAAPAGTRVAQAKATPKKKPFTFWALPSRD